jgi:hypothetical protein
VCSGGQLLGMGSRGRRYRAVIHQGQGRYVLFIRVLANQYFFCFVHLRPEIKSIATNCMPEVVSDSSYDIKKMLESCPQVAS